MPQERTRDKIWKCSLTITLREDRPVKPKEVSHITGVSERTVRETLNVIAAAGWLERDVLPDGTVRFVSPDNLIYRPDDESY